MDEIWWEISQGVDDVRGRLSVTLHVGLHFFTLDKLKSEAITTPEMECFCRISQKAPLSMTSEWLEKDTILTKTTHFAVIMDSKSGKVVYLRRYLDI